MDKKIFDHWVNIEDIELQIDTIRNDGCIFSIISTPGAEYMYSINEKGNKESLLKEIYYHPFIDTLKRVSIEISGLDSKQDYILAISVPYKDPDKNNAEIHYIVEDNKGFVTK